MALLNHTTKIDAERTVAQVSKLLVAAAARSIQIDYDQHGQPIALTFGIQTPIGPESYRLPANPDGVFRTLTRQSDRGLVPRRFVTRQQAVRVAWRILKDWVEAQIAIIESGAVTMDQVLLPYMLAPGGRTVYEIYADRQLKLADQAGAGGAS